MPRLIVKKGLNRGAVYELHEPGATLGRDASNSIHVPSDTVSREHARFAWRDGVWFIQDMDSRNGTLVNGRRIVEIELHPDDEIAIGELVMQFVDAGPEPLVPGALAAETTELAVRESLSADTASLADSLARAGADARTRLLALVEMTRLANSARSLPELFAAVTDLLEDTLHPDRGVPILFDPRQGLVRPWVKAKSAFEQRLRDLPISSSIVDHVKEKRAAVWSQAPGRDRRFKRSRSIVDQKITSALCAPMRIGDRLLGVLYLDRLGDAPGFTHADLEFLTAVAVHVAVAVENVLRHQEAKRQRQVWERQSRGEYDIVGQSDPIRAVFRFIAKAAPADSSVLIEGESGTGKELVARATHCNSPRRTGPFEAVNCAALAHNLLESELFGHVKGAFTGADDERPGRFELADHGSIFLDEVGELPPESQSKLLRVVEQGEVRRLGDVKDRKIDVRVIAATNKNLRAEVDAGRFREDLYFRLNVLRVTLPPLRDHMEDIDLLAEHFLRYFIEKCGKGTVRLAPAAMAVFRQYAWPGNVRELRNVIERMVVMSEGPELDVDAIPYEVSGARPPETASAPSPDRSIADVEKEHIARVLKHAGGNKKEAARILGIDRSTLYARLKAYGIPS